MINDVALFFNNLNFNWSIIECVAVLFSILYVVFAAKENILCWIFASISVCIYIYICFQAKLYAETMLQLFYLIMAFYGYYNWKNRTSITKIRELTITKHIVLIITGALFTFFLGFFLTNYTESKMAITDSFTTVFSIIATYMVTKKILENWIYWIVIDIVSVYLYFSRGLHITSILFIIYTIIAITGYFYWLKKRVHA